MLSTVPTFLLCAEDDDLTEDVVRIVDALHRAHIPVEFVALRRDFRLAPLLGSNPVGVFLLLGTPSLDEAVAAHLEAEFVLERRKTQAFRRFEPQERIASVVQEEQAAVESVLRVSVDIPIAYRRARRPMMTFKPSEIRAAIQRERSRRRRAWWAGLGHKLQELLLAATGATLRRTAVAAAVLVGGLLLAFWAVAKPNPPTSQQPLARRTVAVSGPRQPGEVGSHEREPTHVASPTLTAGSIVLAVASKMSSVPRHRGAAGQPSSCRDQRTRVRSAQRTGDWKTVLVGLGKPRCWPTSDERVLLRTRALLNLGRYAACAAAGSASRDYRVARMAERCRSLAAS